MKKFSGIILTIFILSAFPLSSQTTYEFMRIDMSARAGALAGSYVANNDDPNVIFYNPAGLNLLENSPISFSFVKHLLDINLASLAYSQDINWLGRVGAGIKYINYGKFTEADEFGNRTGDFGAGEIAFLIGYANSLDENFYYGSNFKIIYSSIAGRSSTALAFDVGLHYTIPAEQLNLGISVMNVGGQVSSYFETKEDLPLDIAIGVSKKLQHLPLRLSIDFHKLNEDRDDVLSKFKAFSVGAEFTLSKVLKLRLGYDNEKRSDLKIGSFAGLAGFNLGLGANIKDYNFDYAFSSMGQIGELHRISVTTSL